MKKFILKNNTAHKECVETIRQNHSLSWTSWKKNKPRETMSVRKKLHDNSLPWLVAYIFCNAFRSLWVEVVVINICLFLILFTQDLHHWIEFFCYTIHCERKFPSLMVCNWQRHELLGMNWKGTWVAHHIHLTKQ